MQKFLSTTLSFIKLHRKIIVGIAGVLGVSVMGINVPPEVIDAVITALPQ